MTAATVPVLVAGELLFVIVVMIMHIVDIVYPVSLCVSTHLLVTEVFVMVMRHVIVHPAVFLAYSQFGVRRQRLLIIEELVSRIARVEVVAEEPHVFLCRTMGVGGEVCQVDPNGQGYTNDPLCGYGCGGGGGTSIPPFPRALCHPKHLRQQLVQHFMEFKWS